MSPVNLHPAIEVALAWQPAATRAKLAALFKLDAHLGSLVAKSSEPMLAQIRLAWWRERLSEPVAVRPKGEPILEALSREWQGEEGALVELIDGWEELLAPAPLAAGAIRRFAEARAAAIDAATPGAGMAGQRWAFADFAFRTGNVEEREAALELGNTVPVQSPVPNSLRGLAVLDALARRSVNRREPLMNGRGAALLAWRVGLFGR